MNERLILKSRLSQKNVTLTEPQWQACELAMIDVSIQAVNRYKDNEAKAINGEAVAFFPSIIRGELVAWIRFQYLKHAKKTAQLLADSRNMLHYVIRKTAITYIIIPNDMVDHHKRIGTFRKDITAKELHEISDFVAYPPEREVKVVRVLHKKK